MPEDPDTLTHYFAATRAATGAGAGRSRWPRRPGEGPTVSEVVLLPGADALGPPTWVPWEERVRPGDLGVGDLLPSAEGDRLVPAYVASDDPAVEEAARESASAGRVLSRAGREAASAGTTAGSVRARWPAPPPATCVTCGFFLPRRPAAGAFGVCGNGYAPGRRPGGRGGYGCGAHSEVQRAGAAGRGG